MKKVLVYLVVLAMIVTVFPAFSVMATDTGDYGIMPNGGFESGMAGWGALGSAPTISTTQVHSGTQSLMQVGKDPGYISPIYNIYDILKSDHSGAGGYYEISMWVYADGINGTGMTSLALRNAPNAYSFNTDTTNNIANIQSKIIAADTWTLLKGVIHIQASDLTQALGAGTMDLCTDALACSTVYYDDVKILYLGATTTVQKGSIAYECSFSAGVASSFFASIGTIGTDVLNLGNNNGTATITLKNTGATTFTAKFGSRQADWSEEIQSSAVTIPAGGIGTVTLTGLADSHTMLLLWLDGMTAATKFQILNLTNISLAETIRTGFSGAASVDLITGIPVVPDTGNYGLMPNGGFESALTGWTAIGSDGTRSTLQKHSGECSLRQDNKYAGYISPTYNIYDLIKNDHSAAGGYYAISMWVYADGITSATTQLALRGSPYTYSYSNAGTETILSTKGITADTWTQIKGIVHVTAADLTGAVGHMDLCTDSLVCSTVYYDDINVAYLSDTPTVAAGTAAYEYSFASSVPDFEWANLSALSADVLNLANNNGTATVTIKNTGATSLNFLLNSRNSGWSNEINTNWVAIAAGATATLTDPGLPDSNTMLLLYVNGLKGNSKFQVKNITNIALTSTLGTNTSDGASVFVDLVTGLTPDPTPTPTPAPTAIPTPDSNGITNFANFEDGSIGNWTAPFGGTMSISSTVAHSGTKSISLVGRDYGPGPGSASWYSPAYNIYNILKLQGAGSYSINLWVRSSTAGSIGALLRFASNGQYSFATSIGDPAVVQNYGRVGGTVTLAANTWTLMTGTINVTAADLTAATGTMNLCIDSLSADDVYIDDCSLYKVPEDNILNGNFESPSDLIGWSSFQTGSATSALALSNDAHSGTHSLWFTRPNTYSSAATVVTPILQKHGTGLYTLTYWAKLDSSATGDEPIRAFIINGNNNITFNAGIINKNTWTKFTCNYAVDSTKLDQLTAAGMASLCWQGAAAGSETTTPFMVDDISLSYVGPITVAPYLYGYQVSYDSYFTGTSNWHRIDNLNQTGIYDASTNSAVVVLKNTGNATFTARITAKDAAWTVETAVYSQSVSIDPGQIATVSLKNIPSDHTIVTLDVLSLGAGSSYIIGNSVTDLSMVNTLFSNTGFGTGVSIAPILLNVSDNYVPQYPVTQYTVTYKDYDGTTITTQTVNAGELTTAPTAPTRANDGKDYVFSGWYTDALLTTKCDFAVNTITADTTLYAYWRVLGDLNASGTVTAADALKALQAASGKITLSADDIVLADVNFSGTVTAADALKILQFASGKITTFR